MKQEIEKKEIKLIMYLDNMNGSVGKVDQGIVSVNAYGVYQGITFPLVTRIFKPKGTLKKDDVYQTKIEIAGEIINYVVSFGFKINWVLAIPFLWGKWRFY